LAIHTAHLLYEQLPPEKNRYIESIYGQLDRLLESVSLLLREKAAPEEYLPVRGIIRFYLDVDGDYMIRPLQWLDDIPELVKEYGRSNEELAKEYRRPKEATKTGEAWAMIIPFPKREALTDLAELPPDEEVLIPLYEAYRAMDERLVVAPAGRRFLPGLPTVPDLIKIPRGRPKGAHPNEVRVSG
jgi:hypothetical protein